jgi:hypothetical protein
MWNSGRLTRLTAVVFAATASLVAASGLSQAGTGDVRLRIVKAGFIVGVGGGNGILRYHGKSYRLSISGVGIGSLGIAAVDLVGIARNLNEPTDIVGTYGAAGAGAAFVAGAQAVTLRNEKGVVLKVHGPQAGLQISVGLAGMTIGMR